MACDHEHPVCRRCRNRQQDAECVYSETVPGSKPQSRRTRRQSSTSSVIITGLTQAPYEPVGVNTPAPGPTPRFNLSSPPSRSGSGPGYLGFTSHSTVFEETRQSLSLLNGSCSEIDVKRTCSCTQDGVSFRDLPPTIRAACLYVLQHLPGQPDEQMTFSDGMDNSYEPEGWTHIAVANIVRSLKIQYGTWLENGDAHLEQMAEQICTNTTRPLRDIHTDPREWLDQFCSPETLRWESLGLLWAYLERISDALDALRSGHLAWVPGRRCSATALRCLGYCVDIARHLNEGNDLLLDLCRKKSTLESVTAGDASKLPLLSNQPINTNKIGLSCWTSHALTISMMTYLGAHVQQQVFPYKPSLCSENKRRLFAQVFNADKFTVSFTGRPPLISRRYCSTPMPLDLCDEVLTADEETLKNAVAALDDRGWNTVGGLYPATLVRARFVITVILDELIEISLDSTRGVAVDQLRCVLQCPKRPFLTRRIETSRLANCRQYPSSPQPGV